MSSLAGYQLLSRSRSPKCDHTWADRAHAAATHFPPGTGSWGKIPNQVSWKKNNKKTCSQLISSRGEQQEQEGGCEKMKTRCEERKVVCLLEAQSPVCEINADSVAWKKKASDWSAQPERAWLHPFFVIANSSLKITIWPSALRCTTAGYNCKTNCSCLNWEAVLFNGVCVSVPES